MRNVKNGKLRIPFLGKLCAAFLCASIAFTAVGDTIRTVDASSSGTDAEISALQDKIAQLQKQNEERKKQISSIQGSISGNNQAIKLAQQQIAGIKEEVDATGELITTKINLIKEKEAQIDAVKLTIKDKEQDIKDKEAEIEDLQEQNRQNLRQFAELARQLYMVDPSSTIPVLNGSDDWYKFFTYTDIVKDISRQNVLFMQRLQNSIKQQETLIEELDAAILQLQQDKAELEEKKKILEQEEADLKAEKDRLNAYAQEQLTYLNKLTAQNAQLQSEISSLQSKNSENAKEIEKCNAEIDEIIRKAQEENQGQVNYNDGTFLWPVPKQFQMITTRFGYDAWRGGMHNGIDIAGGGIQGANIYATQAGTVIATYTQCSHNYSKNYYHSCGSGYGNYIVVDHGGGLTTLYAHCGTVLVQKGQHVAQGEIIGKVGCTGWSTGFHLHFEIRENNVKKDPLKYTTYKYIS